MEVPNRVFIVMGHEFYASWSVRVFAEREEADRFRDRVEREYRERCKVTDRDQEKAKWFECAPDVVAETRAIQELRDLGLDGNACGLELGWSVVECPFGDLDEKKETG